MVFARRVFLIAGIYGLVALLPLYFMEDRISGDQPPAITHPEFFYGFIGLALAWQVAFLIIASDPARYRLLIIPSILEKVSVGFAIIALYAFGRIPVPVFAVGLIDLAWGILFTAGYWTAGRRESISGVRNEGA